MFRSREDRMSRLFPAIFLLTQLSLVDLLPAAEPIVIGTRLEPLVDRHLIESLSGDAVQQVVEPRPEEVVFTTDKPWEGNTCAYYTIFQDGDLYRMYYRGSHWDEVAKKATHREVTCYAESRDGIHWTRPELGLHEWDGSKQNNIILDGLGTHCFTPFKDDHPDCPPEARYKALSADYTTGKRGLNAFQSADGIHWSLMRKEHVITDGVFDSQNLAFRDPLTGEFVDYHRTFVNRVRAIMTCTSKDFLTWTKPVLLQYPGVPDQHLYTNAIRPYDRAPHIRIGFPTRFLPEKQQVEPVFMASRDGVTFTRYAEPVIPRTAPADRDGNRSNYMANALVRLPGNDSEYACYGTEAYYTGPSSRLRRFMYRTDGFVRVKAGATGGELVTHPLTFDGTALVLNYKVADEGRLQVELQDAAGQALEGFRLKDCKALSGDEQAGVVVWNSGRSLAEWKGKPVRLRVSLQDAELYSLRFQAEPGR